jgi:hypothetical protein
MTGRGHWNGVGVQKVRRYNVGAPADVHRVTALKKN